MLAITSEIEAYKGWPEEMAFQDAFLKLLEAAPDCFYRDHFLPGHITGSALLVSSDRRRVLMNRHKVFDAWICFGGHADGEANIASVALRETQEESGISDIEFLGSGIFDIDVHDIPASDRKKEPSHKHFDIGYILRVRQETNENFTMSDESLDLRWCGFDEALALVALKDTAMRRMLVKWRDGYA